MVSALLLAGCLERVTGDDVPLDPRFYEGVKDGTGQAADPNAGGTGDGAYVGYAGETIHVFGRVIGAGTDSVQIDINEFDASQPGGMRRAGALHLLVPGPFEIDVPKTVGRIHLQAFQDPMVDGPDEGDPFAEQVVDLEGEPPGELMLELKSGVRGGAGGGAAGPAGGRGDQLPQPGQQSGPQQGAPGSAPPTRQGLNVPGDGPRVNVGGTVTVQRDLAVVLDFFQIDAAAPAGRSFLGKEIVRAGAWSVSFPAGFGVIEIEASQDLTGDSRTGDDPAVRTAKPVPVGDEDIGGIDLIVP